MNLIFYIFDEKCQDQTQARKDKAWQGMARQGQMMQDEAVPRQEGVPWFKQGNLRDLIAATDLVILLKLD